MDASGKKIFALIATICIMFGIISVVFDRATTTPEERNARIAKIVERETKERAEQKKFLFKSTNDFKKAFNENIEKFNKISEEMRSEAFKNTDIAKIKKIDVKSDGIFFAQLDRKIEDTQRVLLKSLGIGGMLEKGQVKSVTVIGDFPAPANNSFGCNESGIFMIDLNFYIAALINSVNDNFNLEFKEANKKSGEIINKLFKYVAKTENCNGVYTENGFAYMLSIEIDGGKSRVMLLIEPYSETAK